MESGDRTGTHTYGHSTIACLSALWYQHLASAEFTNTQWSTRYLQLVSEQLEQILVSWHSSCQTKLCERRSAGAAQLLSAPHTILSRRKLFARLNWSHYESTRTSLNTEAEELRDRNEIEAKTRIHYFAGTKKKTKKQLIVGPKTHGQKIVTGVRIVHRLHGSAANVPTKCKNCKRAPNVKHMRRQLHSLCA